MLRVGTPLICSVLNQYSSYSRGRFKIKTDLFASRYSRSRFVAWSIFCTWKIYVCKTWSRRCRGSIPCPQCSPPSTTEPLIFSAFVCCFVSAVVEWSKFFILMIAIKVYTMHSCSHVCGVASTEHWCTWVRSRQNADHCRRNRIVEAVAKHGPRMDPVAD